MRLARGDEPELHPQGVSRRTFLFLGASAAASLALPAPLSPSLSPVVIDAHSPAAWFVAGRRGGKHFTAMRVLVSGADLKHPQVGAWIRAVRAELDEAVADALTYNDVRGIPRA